MLQGKEIGSGMNIGLNTKIQMLRSTRAGASVRIGRATFCPVKYHPDKMGRRGGCAFKEGDNGAESCGYSPACMAHRREDGESVVFIKL